MNDIFSNPLGWSGKIVGTWLRFWFSAVFLTLILALVVNNWDSYQTIAAAVSGGYQLMLLYAMRKMYVHIKRDQVGKGNAG